MAQIYKFGPFELNTARSVLLRENVPIHLGSRAFAILTMLVENADRIVGSEELTQRVWPSVTVSDSNLRVHLAAIRRALSDDKDGTHVILTAPGIGYKFDIPVSVQKLSAQQRLHSNVPAPLGDLIGREAVIRELVETIEKYRFVSIVGSGGIGKTSVALGVARQVMERYSDGACFIDLAAVDSQSPLLLAVSAPLKLELVHGSDQTALVDALCRREMLLILDNCEQILDEVAALAETILRTCHQVHILATSREPLRAEGEFVRRLLPLQSPPIDGTSLSVSEALEFPAAQLFVQRARSSFPSFSLQDSDGPALAEICNKLDGMPLAIELAATRVDLFDLPTLSGQLDHLLQFLTRGRRTAQERHRTLRATLDWSFRLLSDSEQRLFIRLGVFRNAFCRDAAMAVTGEGLSERASVLEGLASLAAKSLLIVSGENQIPVFRLLESARSYAREKLASSGEERSVRANHAAYLMNRLGELRTKRRSTKASDHSLYTRLADELRNSIAWSFSEGDKDVSVELITASAFLWSELSLFEEYKRYVEQALRIVREIPNSSRAELKLLDVAGPAIYETLGAVPELCTTATRVLELAAELNDRQAETGGLHSLWRYHHGRGEYAIASEITERIRRSLEENRKGELWWKPLQVLCLLYQGNTTEARRTIASLDDRIPFPDAGINASYDYNVAVLINGALARILWLQGMTEAANRCADAALEAAQQSGQSVSICFTLAIAGCPLALWNADAVQAERCLAILREHAKQAKSPYWQQYVNVFEVGLEAVLEPDRSEAFLGDVRSARWDYRHWENFSVLGEGFAPNEFVNRAKQDDNWWCAPQILRLEAHRLHRRFGGDAQDDVVVLLHRANSIARRHKALAWELRIATSLLEVARSSEERMEAKTLLSDALADLAEGLEFAVVRRARDIMERTSRFD
jgi:predicted ATPase/DNA-binding winged helix-turn-helix (wHTH) protein